MMPSVAGLLGLPTELILAIADSFERQRDINALCRTHRIFHQVLNAQLYRHNVQHGKGICLIYGAVVGNTGTVNMALDLGHIDVDTPFSPNSAQVRSVTDRQAPKFVPRGSSSDDNAVLQECRGAGRGLRWFSWTALAFAVAYGRAAVVRLLLDPRHRAFVGAKGFKPSVIHLAAHLGRADMLQILLDLGGDNARAALGVNTHGERWPGVCATPLYLGVIELHCNVVEVLLRELRKPSYGPTAAAEMVGMLMTNSKYYRPGFTTHSDLIRFLLSAEQIVFERIMYLLKKSGAKLDEWLLLPSAAAEGRVDKARFFIENCMTGQESVQPQLLMPLHAAVGNGQVGMTEYLLSIGANPTTRAPRAPHEVGACESWYEGLTAVHAAMKGPDAGMRAVVRLLLEHENTRHDIGNLVNCRTLPPKGLTPLMFLLVNARHSWSLSPERCRSGQATPSTCTPTTSTSTSTVTADTAASSSTTTTHAHPSEHCRCAIPGCAAVVNLLLSAGADVQARSLGGGADNLHQSDDPDTSPRSILYFTATQGCYWCRRAVLSGIGYEAAVAMMDMEHLPPATGRRWRLRSWRRLLGRAWHDEFGWRAEEEARQAKRKGRWKTKWKNWNKATETYLVAKGESSRRETNNFHHVETSEEQTGIAVVAKQDQAR